MENIKLCPGCMRELPQNRIKDLGKDTARCPYCGFCLSEYQQNPRCLPPDTILAGKYLVGKILGEGGFGITYMGYDLNMKTRVAIKEYFPVELVTRDTTRRTAGGGQSCGSSAPGASVSGGNGLSAPGVPAPDSSGLTAGGISSSGGGSDRVISLSGEKSKTYQQGLKKYVDEARNVSQFADIPGIVSVKDFFYENNTAYIVMEYIEGISLKEYLKQKGGKVSEEEALAILRPVLEALEKVHAAGIVHRDISPDNIMLTFTEEGKAGAGQSGVSAVYGNIGAVKLIDFGAARMTSKNDQKSLTIILKHGYAPEEQYRSHGEQGPWTDVYALCAVLYRMLTGKVPEPAMDRLFSDGLKRPEELGAKVSQRVSETIMKGLAVKKEDRIQSVRDLMDALYEGKASRTGKKKNRKILLVACLATVIAVAAAGFLFFGIGKRTRETASLPLAKNGGTVEGEKEEPTAAETGIMAAEEENAASAGELTLEMDQPEEEIEQIVFPKAETMIAAGEGHFLALQDDGTVKAIGDNSRGQCEVTDWDHIVRVYAGKYISAGLRADGTVRIAGDMEESDVAAWTEIEDLAVGLDHIIGLKADGTVVSAGYNMNGNCDVGDWTGIRRIFATEQLSIGITEEGGVQIAGTMSGSEGLQERVETWSGIESITEVYFNGPGIIGVKEDGTICMETDDPHQAEEFAYLKELNDVEQVLFGRGLAVRFRDGRVVQHRWEGTQEWDDVEWEQVAAIAGNIKGLIGLKKDGTLISSACEWTGYGTPEELLSIDDAEMAAWGEKHLAILRKDGTVAATGYGMTTQYEDACATQDWENIVQIDAYFLGTVGITEEGRVCRTPISGASYSSDQNIPDALERAFAFVESVTAWENNCQIICDDSIIATLRKDGTVTGMGRPDDFNITDAETGKAINGTTDVEDWTDIIQIAASDKGTIGLRKDGTVLTTGKKNWNGEEYIVEPGTLPEWENLTDIASIWGGKGAAAAIREDGSVVYLVEGNEENGQNNVSGWENMVELSVGEYHTVGLREDGTVAATGSNVNGQCDVSDWENIVSVAAGPSATIGITADGEILMAGVFPEDYSVMEQWPAVTVPQE